MGCDRMCPEKTFRPEILNPCLNTSKPSGSNHLLRMVSWNLNTLRFWGDDKPRAHHLTFCDWILREMSSHWISNLPNSQALLNHWIHPIFRSVVEPPSTPSACFWRCLQIRTATASLRETKPGVLGDVFSFTKPWFLWKKRELSTPAWICDCLMLGKYIIIQTYPRTSQKSKNEGFPHLISI